MMDIIDHIGNVSGIDAGVYGPTNLGTAQKILSLARYFFATDEQSLPGILTWQYNHLPPYVQGLSETICHNLFVQTGRDETLQQNFFKSRCNADHDTKENINDEKALKSWLQNTPIYLQRQWFDTVENTTIPSELQNKRWSTEITARDRMFLEKLGIQTA